MVAFIVSLIITFALVGVIIRVARNRPVGSPLSWGEAFLAATGVFTLLFMLYGVIPHQFLAYADSELQWRSDKIGIPLGPFGQAVAAITPGAWVEKNLLFPEGVPLPNGYFIVTAEVLRDIIASGLYIVFLLAQIKMWLWWQKRDKVQAATPELTSAYGRPLVRGS